MITPTVSVFGGTSLAIFGVLDLSGSTLIFPPNLGFGGGAPASAIAKFAALPFLGQEYTATDPVNATDCSAGGGSATPHICYWTGTAWSAIGGGFNCATTSSPGFPIWGGLNCVVDPNATDPNLDGNVNFVGATAATGTFGTLNTTGVGFVQTFQSQASPGTSNMVAGQMRWYGDSGSNKWTCLNFDGSSCAPGGAAFSGITAATNSNAGTFAASGNTWDFTGVTIFKMRVGAGLTSSANGDLGYDTTNKMWHIWQNAADNLLPTAVASGSYTDQDCVKFTKSGSTLNLADSGGACGGSGSASPIGFSCGQAVSASATDYCGIGFLASTEPGAQVPVPRSGTVSNLQCRMGNSLSSSQTLTITIRKGLASITAITSSATSVTCTLNSTNTSGCSDGTHNFTVAAGDVLNIQTVPANTPTTGNVNCSVQLL